MAIENARLFETTQRNARALEIVRDILHCLNAVQDIINAFPQLTKGLRELTGCHRIGMSLLEENGEWFQMVALDQPCPELGKGVRMPVNHTSAAKDVLAGRSHLTPDLSTETDHPAEKILYEAGHRSRINLPLRTPEGTIGALNLSWAITSGYNRKHLPILSQIADAIALAVQKKRLFDAERRRVRKLETLRAMAASISSKLEMPKLLQAILEHSISLLSATGGEIGMFEKETQEIVVIACHNMGSDFTSARIPLGRGVMGHVADTGQPIIVSDYDDWEKRLPSYSEGPWRSVIGARS
ncbi:MAG: GAF domain-containing protein [Anaerolineales bacterium]